MEFWKAEQAVIDEANELIGKFHPEIATAAIAFVFKDTATAAEVESGQVCQAKRITGLNKTLSEGDVDFAIVVAADIWSELSPVQQTAMLDSALTSCTIKVDENGDQKIDKAGKPVWAIKPHDIVAHASIIQRYGLEVLRDAGDSIRSFVDQPAPKVTDDSDYDDVEEAPKKKREKK